METKHTPGPWTAHRRNVGDYAIHGGTGIAENRIAIVSGTQNEPFTTMEKMDAEETANAALIAAAPDLLRVCKELFSYLQFQEPETAATISMFNLSRQTLARAEGRGE